MTTIYVLTDPRSNEIRYVGKTTRSLSRRLSTHLSDKRRTHRGAWIKSIVDAGWGPEIREIELVEDAAGSAAEMRWITHYRNVGAKLVNHTDGGEGVTGWKPSAENRQRMSEAQRARRPFSAEHRRKLSEAGKGKTPSAATREKLSAANTGKKRAPDSEETRRRKSIARIGYKPSPKAIEKTAAFHRGRKRGPAPRDLVLRRAEGIKAAWARRKQKLQSSNPQQLLFT